MVYVENLSMYKRMMKQSSLIETIMTSATEALIYEIERFLHASRSIEGRGCLSSELLPHISRLRDLSTEMEAHIRENPGQTYLEQSVLGQSTDQQPNELDESHLRHEQGSPVEMRHTDANHRHEMQPIPLGFEDGTPVPLSPPPALPVESHAYQMLECSSKLIPTLTDAVKCLNLNATPWLQQDHRLSHVTLVNRMQGQRSISTITSVERILAILGSVSLANDYRAFEQISGWQPKHDQLIRAILDGKEPCYARIPDHVKNFTASLGVVERGKLVTSLKFGAKINLVSGLTDVSNYGPGLALLTGFECRKLSRAPYRDLWSLKQLIEGDERFERCKTFCQEVRVWFLRQQCEYNALFSSPSLRQPFQPTSNATLELNTDTTEFSPQYGNNSHASIHSSQFGWQSLEGLEDSIFAWLPQSTPMDIISPNGIR